MKKPEIAVFAASICLSSSAFAATAFTASVINPLAPGDNEEFSLVSFTTTAGTYDSLQVGTITSGFQSGSGGLYKRISGGANGVQTVGEAMNDDFISTGAFGNIKFDTSGNTDNNPDIADFSTTVINDGDNKVFYITENGGNDGPVVIFPLDSFGDPIAGWSTTINTGDWGAINTSTGYEHTTNEVTIGGTAFGLSDFTGGVGILTDVAGLRINLDTDADNVGNLDPSQIGVATLIPEPSSFVLSMLGALGLLRRRRN